MIYVHAVGSYTAPHSRAEDTKALLKAVSGKVFRRTDRFMQLSLIGACLLEKEGTLQPECALYMTSGQGNLSVFNRVRDQKFLEGQLPKPVDFINMLSNTAGFYVAQHFGLHGKNLFLSHHAFCIEQTLMRAAIDLDAGVVTQAIVGGVDECLEPEALTRKLLGVCDGRELGEGSNWLQLSKVSQDAIGTVEADETLYTAQTLRAAIETAGADAVAFSMRCSSEERSEILQGVPLPLFAYEEACGGYYESHPLFAVVHYIATQKGKLLFIDGFEGNYMMMKVGVL